MDMSKKIVFLFLLPIFFAPITATEKCTVQVHKYADNGVSITIPSTPPLVIKAYPYTDHIKKRDYPALSFFIDDQTLQAQSHTTLKKLAHNAYAYEFTLTYNNKTATHTIKSTDDYQKTFNTDMKIIMRNMLEAMINHYYPTFIHWSTAYLLGKKLPHIQNARHYLAVHIGTACMAMEIWAQAAINAAKEKNKENANAANAMLYILKQTPILQEFKNTLNLTHNIAQSYPLSEKGRAACVRYLQSFPVKPITPDSTFFSESAANIQVIEDTSTPMPIPTMPETPLQPTAKKSFLTGVYKKYWLLGGITSLLAVYGMWHHRQKFPQLSKFGF